jgi:lysophospholipase L1-like esterase
MKKYAVLLLLLGLLASPLSAAPRKFEFAGTAQKPLYTKAAGFGFDSARFTTGSKFSIDLPDGNYDVTVKLGDAASAANTGLRAQWRRLLLDDLSTQPAEIQQRTVTINVDTGRLDLEFVGSHPAVQSIEINRNDSAVTVYIAGDSTVCDQEHEPFAGWGQMLPRFFKPSVVAVANHAHSGRAANSFVREKRLDKILASIKPGDYLFVQFAHNDMKQPDMKPFTTYKAAMQVYIDEARKHQAIPVLVTSMHRRFFNPDGSVQNTLREFPEAVRQLASEQQAAMIDLNAMSKTFYEALGPDRSKLAFAQYPAHTFPGQDKELKDNTHFNEYGAFELARCVAEGIKKSSLPLAAQVIDELPVMNTTHPALKPAGPIRPAENQKPLTTPEGA